MQPCLARYVNSCMMLGERSRRPRAIVQSQWVFLDRFSLLVLELSLTGHDFLQQQLHRIGVKVTPDCSVCLCGEAMHFVHLTVCASVANTGFNFSSNNFTAKAGLYWAARRDMPYRAHSSK
ncbi:uncharacterized protein TNCV_228471 [Trichonephila clavipes]|nr:uncharacterized protein TNCV_228471 [Trichonephila clavipes]